MTTIQKTAEEMKQQRKYGLREMMGSHEGYISRTQIMSQEEADKLNEKIICVKWVCLENVRVMVL